MQLVFAQPLKEEILIDHVAESGYTANDCAKQNTIAPNMRRLNRIGKDGVEQKVVMQNR